MSGAEPEITAGMVDERISRLVIDEDPGTTPAEQAYRKAAAVLASFVPGELRPDGAPPGAEALATFLRECEPVYASGDRLEWRLPDAVRRETLESSYGPGELQQAAAASTAGGPVQRMLSAYATGSAPPLEAQTYEDLLATAQVSPWLHGIVPGAPGLDEVKHFLAMAEILAPMHRLVGSSFRGRADVLQRLHDYAGILPPGGLRKAVRRQARRFTSLLDNPPLVLHGPGGVGKSTVLAKFILDHAYGDDRIPFVYIDFDRPGMLPQEPLTLLVDALRQIGAEYPVVRAQAEELRSIWLERLSGPDFGLLASAVIDPPTQLAGGSPDVPESINLRAAVSARKSFYQEFAKVVAAISNDSADRPLLFALDTFETVQYYGSDVVREVWEFLDGLQRQFSSLRVVIAGRAPLAEYPAQAVPLSGFDEESARGFLSSLLGGELAADRDLVDHIVSVVGRNPLSLRLAADLAVNYGAARLRGVDARRELFVRVKAEEVQGYLYKRVLDRIADPDVRSLAHPGLVVRRLTPDVIRYVLATPCGVDVPDDARAQDLFSACSREVSLLSWNTDGSLQHRADIRREMLPLLQQAEPDRVQDIHSAAVSYYERHSDIPSRAEELYHRLCLRDSVESLDQRWQRGVENYLAMSLEELPAEGQVYLASRLGITLPPDVVDKVRLQEQEQYAATRVRQLIRLDELGTALEVLREQVDRSQRSPLDVLEAQVLEGLGRLGEASAVLDQASQRAAEAADSTSLGELQYAAARLAERQGGTNRALELVAAARATKPELPDPMMSLRLWTTELRLRRTGLRELRTRLEDSRADGMSVSPAEVSTLEAQVQETERQIPATQAELLRLVDVTPQEQIAQDPALLAELASEIGEERPAVVLQALMLLGLDALTSAQAGELANVLAEWDTRNDQMPGSGLPLPAGLQSPPAAWAEWVRNNPAKAATRTLVDILNRYPHSEPVIAVLSGIYRDSLSASRSGDWAICCSGGGIRSAAYCLGALQGLDQGGLLAKAKWIVGVSGGSYIAASRGLVASNLPAGARPRAYAPGTPEELNLRDNTRYIAPNATIVLVGVLSLFLGAMTTFILALAPVYAVAHAWGWLLRWQGVLTAFGPHTMIASVVGPGWWLPTVIAAGLTLVLFAFWWQSLEPAFHRRSRSPAWRASLKPDGRESGANRAQLVGWAAALTAALALGMLAAPVLISWLTRSTGAWGTIAHFVGFGTRPSWSLATLAGVVAALAAIARFCQAGLAKWNALGHPAGGQGAAVAQPGPLTLVAGWLRQNVLPWLGSAAIVFIGIVLALLWTSNGARAGFTADQLVPVLIALMVWLLTRVVADVNRLSMHDFYRWRLANAFAVTRRAAQDRDPARTRALFSAAAATRLSDLRDRHADEPGLVICGTANINAAREVPPGRGGFCVTFDPEYVTLHRDQGMAAEPAQALTSDYEALLGQRRCTLFDVSAISGAAISPLMGAATRHAYRILLTATNVRLGVWLPHPALVRAARQRVQRPGVDRDDRWWTRRPLLLLAWYMSRHPLWDRNPARNFDREARLWAHVLMLRIGGKRSGGLWYRAMQPTLGMLWAEAAGHLSYRDTWMYVTDGGHYDNLGLVEALRRGAIHIVVLDASGDKSDTWSTLGGAFALARTDAGVEINLDPTAMVRGGQHLAPGQVVHPWVHGTFTRPEGVPGLAQQGEIWVCKLGWWAGAPWDVQAYARAHPTYPCDSTLEQLYDVSEFEAYRELGAATVLDAAERCVPPLKWVPAPVSPPAQETILKAPPGVASSQVR